MEIVLAIIGAIGIALITLRYPVVALAFYLTTSFVKPLLFLYVSFFQVVDYTLICALLMLWAMTYNFIRDGGRFREIFELPMGLFIALAIVLLFGVLYTSAPHYGFLKSSRFAVLNFISFASPLLFVRQIRTINHIFVLLVLVGLMISVGTIIAPHAAVMREMSQRASFFETSPLEAASMMATAAVICFCWCIVTFTTFRVKIISALMIPVILTAIIISGSRGPLLGFGLCAIAALFLCRKQISAVAVPLMFAILLCGSIWMVRQFPAYEIRRTMTLFSGSYDVKEIMRDRTQLFGMVWENFGKSPIVGRGTGAYAMDMWGKDERKFPHNIILELLYENGIIGVIIFIFYMWAIYRRWRDSKRLLLKEEMWGPEIAGYVNIVGLLVLFTLSQAMKSSDIEGNRFMFFCCGLVLASFKCLSNEYEAQLAYEAEGIEPANDTDTNLLYDGQQN